MKKIIASVGFCITIISCNSSNTNTTNADTANTKAPMSIHDTGTQHPNGVTSDGVISTDTSGFGVKASSDSSHKKH